MTVEELIGVLEEYNPNATVLMDSGDIYQVEVDDASQTKDKRYVVIS